MNLLDAAEKAEKNENIRKLKGYFLGSSFASLLADKKEIAEWTFLYYNPTSNTIVDCVVNEKFITVGEQTQALKEMKEIHPIDMVFDIENVLENLRENFKKIPISTLISLHMKEFSGKNKLVWTIAFVAQDLSATSFDVDAITGKILREETTSLTRKL